MKLSTLLLPENFTGKSFFKVMGVSVRIRLVLEIYRRPRILSTLELIPHYFTVHAEKIFGRTINTMEFRLA